MPRTQAPRRNHNGEGTLRNRSNGSFEYRISYFDEDGIQKRKSFYGQSDTICFQKAEDFLNKLEKIKSGIDTEATIPDIVKSKCKADYDKNYVHEQGYFRNLDTLKIIEKSPLGQIPISEISESQVDFYLRSITHYSNSTIVKVYRQIRLAFRIAADKGIVEKNLMLSDALKCPKSSKKDKKVTALTREEQAVFLEYLHNFKVPNGRNNYKNQILISLYTGMRMGEVNALKPKDIDLKKKMIHVHSTVSIGENFKSFVKEDTKTEAGIRDIPISKQVEPVLNDALANYIENPQGLLFYDHDHDKVITTCQVNSFFTRICQKCDINVGGQHALRHTFATRCIEADIQAVVLKNWLGHTDIHITLDTYADVFSSMHHDSISKLDEYISSINKAS